MIDCLRLFISTRHTYFMFGLCAQKDKQVWELWPWPLAKLLNPACSAEEKDSVRAAWRDMNACCPPPNDGLSWVLHTIGRDDLMDENLLQLLRDVFQQTPLTNIITEDRFARHRRHAQQSGGHAATPSTHASNHMVSEFRALWENAKAVHRARTGIRYDAIQQRKAIFCGSFFKFVATATKGLKVGPSYMSVLAARWRAMSPQERAAHASDEVAPAAQRLRLYIFGGWRPNSLSLFIFKCGCVAYFCHNSLSLFIFRCGTG